MIKKGKYINLNRRVVRKGYGVLLRVHLDYANYLRTLDARAEWKDIENMRPDRRREFMRRVLRTRCSFY